MIRVRWPAKALEDRRGDSPVLWVDRTAAYAPSPDVRFTESEDMGTILDLRGERYYGLGGVGARIWRLLEGGETLPSVVDRLAEEYDAPRERLDADAEAFVADMVRRGFMVKR